MIQPRVLRGMRDFLPAQMILRRRVMETFREVFERHGFEPIETPVLEYFETLTGNLDDEKLIYHFQDHGGREVGLRFDLTVPLARFVALHQNELTFPFKRYHIAPVWRADRPQRGRFREFWQCDADIVGSASMLADADVVSVVVECLEAIEIGEFQVRINHRKLLEAIARYAGVDEDRAGGVYRSIDKLDKIGAEGVIAELRESGVFDKSAGAIVELVGATGSPSELLSQVAATIGDTPGAADALKDLSELFDALAASGVPEERYRFDLSLARGMGYYTGPVYEAVHKEVSIGSLAGAGRYDGLVGRFSKQELPATGISLGIERIFEVIQEQGRQVDATSVTQVLVTVFDQEHSGESLRLATELRRAGIRTEVYLEPRRNMGRQFAYADAKGIPLAAVLGPDEIERGVVAIKDLRTQEQTEHPREEVAEVVLRMTSAAE
ncbi:MAG TPA: histidine--tRNA ligase [Thermomicrobiales bacterium]|nr:histidine--tRNA ligase [Thermomicrobiales bacterium]